MTLLIAELPPTIRPAFNGRAIDTRCYAGMAPIAVGTWFEECVGDFARLSVRGRSEISARLQ